MFDRSKLMQACRIEGLIVRLSNIRLKLKYFFLTTQKNDLSSCSKLKPACCRKGAESPRIQELARKYCTLCDEMNLNNFGAKKKYTSLAGQIWTFHQSVSSASSSQLIDHNAWTSCMNCISWVVWVAWVSQVTVIALSCVITLKGSRYMSCIGDVLANKSYCCNTLRLGWVKKVTADYNGAW